MPYSPTGITTSTANLPATASKSNMPTGSYPPGEIFGSGSRPTSRPSSRPPTAGSSNLNPETIRNSTSKPVSLRSTTSKHKPPSLAPSAHSHHSIAKPVPSPMYEEVAKSPPLTSFLNDRYAASTAQESVYLEHIRKLRFVKYLLSALIIAVAAGALGTSSHALHSYNSTHLGKAWTLSLWPVDIDLKPTIGILIPSAIIIVSSILYLSIAIIPSPHSRTSLLSTLYLSSTTTIFLVSLFSTAFYTALVYNTNPSRLTPSHPFPRQTIQSFTCSFYRGPGHFAFSTADLGIPTFGLLPYPSGFGRVCKESEASLGLMVGVLGLSIVAMGLYALGRYWEKGIEQGRRTRYDEKWGGKDSKEGSLGESGTEMEMGSGLRSGKVTPEPVV